MRFSCADYSWPALGLSTVVDVIGDLGFDGIDLAVFGETTHVTVSEVTSRPEGRADQIVADVSRRGLEVADVFLTGHAGDLARLSPTSRNGDDVEQLARIYDGTARFAAGVGSAGITLLPGIVEPGRTESEAFALAGESLSRFIDIAAKYDLTISVEPHIGSLIPTPEKTLELLEMVPGLGITLDPAHYVFQGCTVIEMLPLLPYTRHLQARFGDEGVMQARRADNRIDYPTIVHALIAGSYGEWLASEFVWMEKWDCDRVDNTAESAAMLDYLAGIVADAA